VLALPIYVRNAPLLISPLRPASSIGNSHIFPAQSRKILSSYTENRSGFLPASHT